MRPTLFGARSILFYLVVVGAYFAAPYQNLFFLLLAFLSVHWVLGLWWTWRSLRGTSGALLGVPMVAAGTASTAIARVEVQRGVRFDVTARLFLARSARVGKKEGVEGRAALVRGREDIEIAIPPLPRGVHRIERATLASTYPFGLLRRSRRLATTSEIVVYPAPASIATDARGAEDLMREMLGDHLGGSGDLQPSGLRDHRTGDSLRSVHWRASARRGRPVVLEWEGGSGEGLEVVLDRRCGADDLECALSELCAIVMAARDGKEVLSIRTQGTAATFGDGHESWDRALRLLAEADALPAEGPAPPPASPSVLRLPRSAAHA